MPLPTPIATEAIRMSPSSATACSSRRGIYMRKSMREKAADQCNPDLVLKAHTHDDFGQVCPAKALERFVQTSEHR
jgi:hypothetical protein